MSIVDTPSSNLVQGEAAYSDPHTVPSSVGPQIRIDHFYKKALIEIRNQQFFQPLANVRAMPKHMGKTIKQYKYIPVLDDRNNNDQGIDAAGVAIAEDYWAIWDPTLDSGAGAETGVTYADQAAAQAAADTDGNGGIAFLKSGGLYGSVKILVLLLLSRRL